MKNQRLFHATLSVAVLASLSATSLVWAARCSGASGHVTVNCTDMDITANNQTITVDSGATVSSSGTNIAVENDGSGQIFTNNGTITGATFGYNNINTTTTLTNNSNITGGGAGVIVSGTINELDNTSGTISSTFGQAIFNQGTITSLNNQATISGDSAGIFNTGAIVTTLNNSGTIASANGNGVESDMSAIDTLTNSGTISGNITGVYNLTFTSGSSSLATFTNTNTGTITGTNGYGIINQNTGIGNFTLGTLNNAGHIAGLAGEGIYNENSGPGTFVFNTLINSGTITGTNASGIYNASVSIGTITNTGTITGSGAGSFGISNNTDFNTQVSLIGTLNNLQGGNTPLTYHGLLPTNYNVMINSPTSYGKLVVDSPSGVTHFGIYTGSTVAPGTTYASVLSGLAPSGITNFSGTYNGYQWIIDEVGTSSIWDLMFLSISSPPAANGPSLADEQASANVLGASQRNMLVGSRSTANEVLGMTRPINTTSYTYAGGMFGSAVGYVGGQYSGSHSVSLLGGVAYGKQDYANIEQSSSTTIALAGRYLFGEEGNRLRPFAEIGGWITPDSDLTLSRSYRNSAANQQGYGSTHSTSWAEYGRLGLAADVSLHNKLTGYAEYGGQSMRFGGYSEDMSTSNPYPATIDSGTLRMDVVRFGGSATHMFDKLELGRAYSLPVSVTIAGALARAVNVHSGLRATVAGVGAVSAASQNDAWAEFGARIEGKLTDSLGLDLDVSGSSGTSSSALRTSIHAGVGATYKF